MEDPDGNVGVPMETEAIVEPDMVAEDDFELFDFCRDPFLGDLLLFPV